MVQAHDAAASRAVEGGGDPHRTFGTSWLSAAESRVLEDERETPYTKAASALVGTMRTNLQLNQGVLDRAGTMQDDFHKWLDESKEKKKRKEDEEKDGGGGGGGEDKPKKGDEEKPKKGDEEKPKKGDRDKVLPPVGGKKDGSPVVDSAGNLQQQ